MSNKYFVQLICWNISPIYYGTEWSFCTEEYVSVNVLMKFENLFTFGPNKTRGKCMHDTMFIPLACNFDYGRAISLAWYCFKSVLNFSKQFRRSLLHNFNIHVIPFHVMLKKSSALLHLPVKLNKEKIPKTKKIMLISATKI